MNWFRRMQKIIACLLLVSMLAALAAGCGAAQETPAAPKAAVTQTQSNVPAWQQKWDQTVAAAKKEGTLTIYGDVTPMLREALKAFQNKYGIQMEIVFGISTDITEKWLKERDAGLAIADVFHLSSGLAPSMKPKGGFVAVDPHFILPEASDPKLWLQGKLPFVDPVDKTVLALNSTYTSYVTVNTDIVKEGQLKSYRDLYSPQWKDKVVFFDPTVPSASLGLAVFLMKDIFGLEGGKDFFRQFAASRPAITRDAAQQIDWVVRGKNPIGVGVGSAVSSDYKARGAPVTINRFVEGGSINAGSGILEVPPNSPHPNATKVYINWLMTEEGQAVFAKGMAAPPMRLGVNVEGIDPAKIPLPGEKVFLYDLDHSNFNPEATKILKEIFADQVK